MKPVRRKKYLTKIYDFSQVADQDIIIDIIEGQMIPRRMRFEKFLMQYQLRHYDKYNRYLEF